MKYCIIGSTGLLGKSLIKECKKRKIDFVGIARKNADVVLDISDIKQIIEYFTKNKFDVVINAAAIVNFKDCEEHPEQAYLINSRPSSILSNLSKNIGFKYIYISTDGYFYGEKNKKHDEKSPVTILNEYTRTKFIGECFSLTNKNSLVIRTNIIGFKRTSNSTFFEWILNSLKKQEEITLFDDYYTSSISVSQFSKSLIDLIAKKACGLYNLASREVSSKKNFIEQMSIMFNLELKNIKIGSVRALSPKRADSLGLDVSKAEKKLGYKLPNLKEVLIQLKKEYDEFNKI